MPYRRGRKWVAQVRKQGMRKEKVFSTKKEAIEWETQQRKLTPEDWQKKTNTVCLLDWANAYLDFSQTKFTEKTYKEKKAVFRRFFREINPALSVDKLKPFMVLTYLQKQAKRRSGYAANKDRKNLVAAWNWGIKYMDLPTPNPCMVERFAEKRKPRYVPPEEDFWAVYDVAQDQDKVMLLAYLHLAARRGELFRLKWEDVRFDKGMVRLSTRKRRGGDMEYDWLPLTDELYDALLAHKQKSDSEWVFCDPESGKPYKVRAHWMKRLCRRAGVKHFGIHAIRHLTASLLAQAGVPLIQIQAILRHKNLTTTERYIKRLADLKPALQILSNKKSRLIEPSTSTKRQPQLRAVK